MIVVVVVVPRAFVETCHNSVVRLPDQWSKQFGNLVALSKEREIDSVLQFLRDALDLGIVTYMARFRKHVNEKLRHHG